MCGSSGSESNCKRSPNSNNGGLRERGQVAIYGGTKLAFREINKGCSTRKGCFSRDIVETTGSWKHYNTLTPAAVTNRKEGLVGAPARCISLVKMYLGTFVDSPGG